MKYSVQIFAIIAGLAQTTAVHSATLEESNDHAAVDAARATHDVPEGGGDYEVVVNCLETVTTKQWVSTPTPAGSFIDLPRTPGEICRFRVRHEPADHLREAIETKRAEVELATRKTLERATLKAELLAEIAAEQAAAVKGQVSK